METRENPDPVLEAIEESNRTSGATAKLRLAFAALVMVGIGAFYYLHELVERKNSPDETEPQTTTETKENKEDDEDLQVVLDIIEKIKACELQSRSPEEALKCTHGINIPKR